VDPITTEDYKYVYVYCSTAWAITWQTKGSCNAWVIRAGTAGAGIARQGQGKGDGKAGLPGRR
jgi:hypothetical protein